jgi:prepilin-type N-terminal cleavage/methylation domain-containing protein
MGHHRTDRHSQRFTRSGFTLVELMVVIGIIVVLVGILIPVVSRVRMSGYAANTQQEISVIENAIARYYDDFHAYPGPFPNSQIALGNVPGGAQVKDQNQNTYPVTMSENCFLGLVGAITSTDAVTGPAVGTGPLSLNPLVPKRYAPYIDGVTFSSNSIASYTADAQGNPLPLSTVGLAGAGMDSPVPEFMDRFPIARPILYMRANVGATGVISKLGSTMAGQYQYDLGQISAYTTGTTGSNNVVHPLSDLGANKYNTPYTLWPSGTPANSVDAIVYFTAESVVPTNLNDPNATGTPRAKDGYILISAGPDGLYGTYDDICSFGPVQQ